ncbi:MAG TPA: hypothetical protein DCF45_11695, partial [Gammaproteobacteria bacterium]|nr:hypothetical protein [Gammaproteobacteria bacterium]
MYYEVGAKQIQGGRDYQEDSFQVYFPDPTDEQKEQAMVVMADGMGGHAGGAVASELVVDKVIEIFGASHGAGDFPAVLREAADQANRSIQERTRESPELQGMGCTLVAINLRNKLLNWLSIGDSLLYLIRDGEVIRKNDDHSYGGYLDKLIAAGEEVPETPGFTPRRNMLMSYINGEEIAMIDCPEEAFRLYPGDRLIVASDGLDTVPVDEFPFLSKKAVSAQEMAEALIGAVEDAGKKNQDNTTVIVVDVIGSPGDDTTDQTPGDWVGDTWLPIDPTGREVDITVQGEEDQDESTQEEAASVLSLDADGVGDASLSSEAETGLASSSPSVSRDSVLEQSVARDAEQLPSRAKGPLIAAAVVVLLGVVAGVFLFLFGGGEPQQEPRVSQLPRANLQQPTEQAAERDAVEKAVVETPEPAQPVIEIIQDALKSGGKGPKMAMLPAGKFTQGSSASSPAFDERPPRDVILPRFAISITEVTFADYDLFVKQVGGSVPADQGWGRNRRPVINVSWDDARAYAAWLSDQTGHQYRLPSESEWEYAARAGSVTPYWWGWKPDHGRANCFLCGSDWDGVKSAPVGSFPAN